MTLVKPKKNLGQHFLRNEDIARQIAESIATSPENVLEIGPGMGVLTKYLIHKNYGNFNVVEIDRESVAYLQLHYPALREHIWAKDFLGLDLSQLFEDHLTIIGNFPYNISSQILFKVLDYKELVNEVVGMFQKEVAERVAAKPGNKQYGILSVRIYPNPATDYLNVNMTAEAQQVNVTVVDMSGKVLYTDVFNHGGGTQIYKVPVSELSSGIYFMNLMTPTGKTVQKFIVR